MDPTTTTTPGMDLATAQPPTTCPVLLGLLTVALTRVATATIPRSTRGVGRSSAHEGVGLELGSDHRLEMTIAWAETPEQVEDLARLGDGVADVAKLIGEAFELGAAVVDGHVTLMKVAQLRLEVGGALDLNLSWIYRMDLKF